MRPKERHDTGQSDLLRSRLDAIIDMGNPLMKLALTVDWRFLEQRFGAVFEDRQQAPPTAMKATPVKPVRCAIYPG
jgi:hypothetical protein